MIKEALTKCLNNSDPAQSLRGFLLEAGRYKYSEPVLYNGIVKKAVSLVGSDFLVDCFANKARDKDIALIQVIEKKSSDQKITRDEILNYLQQGGIVEVLEKSAFDINNHLQKFAGIGDLVAPIRKNLGMSSLSPPKTTRGILGSSGPKSPVQMGALNSAPNILKAPKGQSFIDPRSRR